MTTGNNLISGLASGIDWKSMVDQLIAVERRRVSLVENKKTSQLNKLAEWQSFNTRLLALKTSAVALKSPDDFNVYRAGMTAEGATSRAADLLSVKTTAAASAGSYSLKINSTAKAQKLSSASFASVAQALGAACAGEIVINGKTIQVEATDTLAGLRDKINAANTGASPSGVQATIVSYAPGDHRLILTSAATGAQGVALQNGGPADILNLLGFTDAAGGFSDVYGLTGDVANTAGGAAITAQTLLKDIDGYAGYAPTDYIRLEGTDTGGNAVDDAAFVIGDTTTVGDLLNKIRDVFGNVTASITAAGRLHIVDETPGQSTLAVKIGVKDQGGAPDNTLQFAAAGDLGAAVSLRKRQITAGADASLTLDGVTLTRTTNVIDDVLAGVTLDLLKADAATTVTLTVGRDIDAVMAKIGAFVQNYNNVASYLRTQMSYDSDKKQVGGILFADGTLRSVKTDLSSVITQAIPGAAADFATLGLVGISVDVRGQLTIDNDKLRSRLNTGFSDVVRLFAATGETSAGSLRFVSHGAKSKAGEYVVHITQAAVGGLDVAGTINGEAATGSGQLLTGNQGTANVEGLSVEYTGTASGVDAGTVKLTLGVAELFNRALYNITDIFDGYVTGKQNSIQGSISDMQVQIEAMDARIERKRQQMLNRFAQMEKMMQRLQSQSNWLAGQATAASNGWKKLA